ncbi:streptophobe family protein [Streptomyces sp. NPDC046853]|uniref:streptophobe family protein n=1 Tax=Streptomyces sp. NPDC046853 TaxID=3154920 RepID=UPI0033D1EB6C
METGDKRAEGRGVRWGDVLLSAIAAVSWALVGMAGTAALGLHLLGADAAASLGPMTAAVVALGAGGSVTPSGDVSAFGLEGAEATTAIDVAPLGVGLAGAVLLAYFFLRSLRGAGVVISPAELAARAGAVIVLFVGMLGGLAWAGHDIITIKGDQLGIDQGIDKGIDQLPDDITDKLPGGLGDIGGLLPDRLGDLAQAKASVGFTVETGPTLLGGAVWVLVVLLIALLASRRTPLPRGWDVVHRVVRPASSALVTVLLVAVLAGLAAALYAMIGDDHPKRIAGAALLGAPNGVWLGVPVGLFVPWDGEATGQLAKLLPDPVDDLLTGSGSSGSGAVTLGRLAEIDGRVWLLGVAAALMILFAGVLTAVRTPYLRGETGALRFAGQCAVRLGVVTALGLPLLVWLTGVSADASLSVLGFDAFGAGIELHGQLGMALLLGAVWGAGAGAVGALLAVASGAAGGRVSVFARVGAEVAAGAAGAAGSAGGHGTAGDAGRPGAVGTPGSAGPTGPPGAGGPPGAAGPYSPSAPYRPSNPDTNPYLRPPRDVSGAPTVAGPVTPPPRPKPRPRPSDEGGEWPPPPPPPPPPPGPRSGPRGGQGR